MTGPLVLPSSETVAAARRSGTIAELVESTLSVLVGLDWQYLSRAADMVTLGFGPEVLGIPMPIRDDWPPERKARIEERNRRPFARFALHVQCPFRVDSPRGPAVGGRDIYLRADPPHPWIEGRDFTGCLYDRRVAEIGEHDGPPFVIEQVTADRGGGFLLEVAGGWTIVVAPSSGAEHELWRFFDRTSEGDHFVVFHDLRRDDGDRPTAPAGDVGTLGS